MPGMIQPKREITYRPNGEADTVTVWPIVGGKPVTRTDMRFTKSQFDLWQSGVNIERAMPMLNPEEREVLMSGLDQAAWDAMWKDD